MRNNLMKQCAKGKNTLRVFQNFYSAKMIKNIPKRNNVLKIK